MQVESQAAGADPGTAVGPVPVGRNEGGRFRSLDGIRALAAIAVLFTHAADYSTTQHGVIADYFAQLNIAVAVFFGLSGFLLYRPFALAHLRRTRAAPAHEYATRRLLRIYPAYWVAVAATVYLLGELKFTGAKNTIFGFSLLQLYGGSFYQGLPQAWTLCVEVSFYAFLPVYAFLVARGARRYGLGAELAGVAVLAATGLGIQVARLSDAHMPLWLDGPGFGAFFAAGMLLAVLHVRREVGGGFAWLDRLARSAAAGVAVALFAFLLVIYVVRVHADHPSTPHQDLARYLLEIVIILALLVPAVFGPVGRGPVRGFLRHPVMVFLGMISYGIYLWHYPILVLMSRHGIGDGHVAVTAPVALVLTILLATVSWYALERPLVRWSQQAWRRRPRLQPVAPGVPASAAPGNPVLEPAD